MQDQINQLKQRIAALEAQLAESNSLPSFNDIDYTRLDVRKIGLSDDPTYIQIISGAGVDGSPHNVMTTPALFAKVKGTNYFLPVYQQSQFII